MSKNPLSTFNREMKNDKFRKSFEEGYREFILSEILIELMKDAHKTVRGLAHEVGLSPTIIQKVRSGDQQDLKLSNFLTIAESCGYHLCLEKGEKRFQI